MTDMKWIRKHREELSASAKRRGMDFPIKPLLALDDERRELLVHVEELRARRNKLSADIAGLLAGKQTGPAELAKAQVKELNMTLAGYEARLGSLEQELRERLLTAPNVISADTPDGASDADNTVVKVVGSLPAFDFEPKDHVRLGEELDLFDIPRGVKTAGTRNYYLKGMGLYLHRAVQQLALDYLADRGYTVMDVPLMVREEMLVGTGFFPAGKDQTYELKDENKWLAGTSEAPLISYFAGEVIDLSGGPIRLAAVSNCFRKEAGSAGKDVRGLYRVHQFAKVEQVVFCEHDLDAAEEMLAQLVGHAEEILRLLELPYRIVAVCAGDLAAKNYKQFDIETWMPSRQHYGETHSASSLLDYQARRSGIRYRDRDGALQYAYTLNNTAVASPRILIPLIENHQQADGSLHVPEALRPYMRGVRRIANPGNMK